MCVCVFGRDKGIETNQADGLVIKRTNLVKSSGICLKREASLRRSDVEFRERGRIIGVSNLCRTSTEILGSFQRAGWAVVGVSIRGASFSSCFLSR